MRIHLLRDGSPHEPSRGERRGTALGMALFLLTGLVVLTYSVFHVAASSARRTSGSLDDRRAFLLAEAGLHESYEALRMGGTGSVASQADPAYLGGGVLWVDATDLGGDRYRLVSTGLVGSGRKALEAIVEVDDGQAPIFEATLNSREQITLNSEVLVDSYDSAQGTYASQATNVTNGHTHANTEGHVRSNQDVVVNSNATIFGDAKPGPGHSVLLNAGSYVSGSITPGQEAFSFPAISVPSYPAQPSLLLGNSGSSTIPAGDHYIPGISIGKQATLTIEGPANVVVDDFSGGKDANLLIDASNGPVAIYVKNSYSHLSGFEADAVAGSPMSLAFLVEAAQDIVFPSNTNIRGAYYLPNANISFSAGNECWGAFAANRIDMSNGMRFHFDEDLLNHFEADTGQEDDGLDVLSWTETGVSPPSLLADRRDPIAALGLDRNALRAPGLHWEGVDP